MDGFRIRNMAARWKETIFKWSYLHSAPHMILVLFLNCFPVRSEMQILLLLTLKWKFKMFFFKADIFIEIQWLVSFPKHFNHLRC